MPVILALRRLSQEDQKFGTHKRLSQIKGKAGLWASGGTRSWETCSKDNLSLYSLSVAFVVRLMTHLLLIVLYVFVCTAWNYLISFVSNQFESEYVVCFRTF